VKPREAQTWLEQRASGVRGSELVAHEGRADPITLGRRIATWLEGKGFQTNVIAAERTCIVKAETADGWKKTIGASPSLEAQISSVASGTEVDVRPGRVAGAVWTARYFTSSWVASGVSFVSLKRDVLQFVRQELEAHGGMIQGHAQILDVVETARSAQSLGNDERRVDNSDSDTTVTRSIKATKRWRQSCTLEIEKSRVNGQSVDLKLADVVALKDSMEETLRRQYVSSTEEEQTFEEEVTLEVPPRTSLRFIMEWKRIIQEGYVRLRDPAGRTIEVPFAMAVGVTFDQRQIGAREADSRS
jgi:hypothetical protein